MSDQFIRGLLACGGRLLLANFMGFVNLAAIAIWLK
jgi:hypothetical protein